MKQIELSAFTQEADTVAAAEALATKLRGADARAVVFFCTHHHDGAALSRILREKLNGAEVIGCTHAGGFTEGQQATSAVVALALPGRSVAGVGATLARFDRGVDAGVAAAAARLGAAAGKPLSELDPARWVGIVLLEGLRGKEEHANVALGNVAPLLSFVGGSAGDGGEFVATRVFCNGEACDDGAALLLLEMKAPFSILKTCSFAPTDRVFAVTRADVARRMVYELDHRPVLEAYAEAVGVAPSALGPEIFMKSPVGLMLDGEPWIRSPQRVTEDGGLRFYCQIEEGMRVTLMRSTDLCGDTRAAVARAKEDLGADATGALLFNCILRRLELDAAGTHGEFLRAFEGLSAAGFHTYGESWLGYVNQTCTGLIFG
jgi:hypothetical protein